MKPIVEIRPMHCSSFARVVPRQVPHLNSLGVRTLQREGEADAAETISASVGKTGVRREADSGEKKAA